MKPTPISILGFGESSPLLGAFQAGASRPMGYFSISFNHLSSLFTTPPCQMPCFLALGTRPSGEDPKELTLFHGYLGASPRFLGTVPWSQQYC